MRGLTIIYLLFTSIFANLELQAQDLIKISVGHDGSEANGNSSFPHVSGNGKHICFESAASNLIPNDTNGVEDIFIWHKSNGAISRISVDEAGIEANNISTSCVVSKSGRYIAYSTSATNIVSDDTGSAYDVILFDTKRNLMELISASTMKTGGNDNSAPSFISDNGRYVLFQSKATDLVSSDTNGKRDVFLRDRKLGTTTLISKNNAGIQTDEISFPEAYYSMSADNRYISYISEATNLHTTATPALIRQVYIYDRRQNKTKLISVDKNNLPLNSSIARNMFSRDSLLSVYAADDSTNVLADNDNNLTYDTYERKRKSSNIKLVSQNQDRVVGQGGLTIPRGITQTGRYILMITHATNLVPTSTNSALAQFVLKDRRQNRFSHVTVSTNNEAANASSLAATISMTGTTVAFDSLATNLTAPDNGLYNDVYVRRMRIAKDSL